MQARYLKKQSRAKTLSPSARFILSLVLVTFVCAFMLSAQGFADKVFPADVAVVPGNEVFADGTLSPRLQSRVNAAYGLYRHGMVKKIIVSGGTGKSGVNEAMAMWQYLRDNHIPADDIIVDMDGVDTRATARFTGRYMREHDLHSVIAVSQFFHLPRMAISLNSEDGIEAVGTLHSNYFEGRDLYSLLREIPACFAYWAQIK